MAEDVVKVKLQVTDGASGPLKDTAKAADEASKSSKEAQVSMKGVATAALTVAAAMGATAGAVIGFIQSAADARNQLTDMSIRTGVAATTLAGLKLAAEGSGLSLSQFESALSQLPRRMMETSQGTGESKEAFEALGVSVVDTSGELKSADEVLRDSVKALGQVESPTKRAALATDLFGRAGGRMLQALGDGSKLDLYIQQAERFGIDVGPAAAKAAQDWQQQTSILKNTLSGMGDAIGGAFGLDGGAAEHMELLNFALIYTSELATEILLGLYEGFRDVGIVTQALLSGNFDLANEVNARIVPMEEMLAAANETAFKAATEFQNFSTQAVNVGGAPKEAVTAFGGAVESTASSLAKLGTTAVLVAPTIEDLLDELAGGDTWEVVTDKAADLRDALADLQDELGLGLSELDSLRMLEIDIDLAFQRGTLSATEYADALELIRLTRDGLEAQGVVEAEVALTIDATAINDLIGAGSALAGGDFTGAAGGALAAAGAATPVAGAVLAGVDLLAQLGEEGADAILDKLEAFQDSVVAGLEALPELIPSLLSGIVEFIPELIESLAGMIPQLIVSLTKAMFDMAIYLLLQLPWALIQGIWNGITSWWDGVKPDWWGAPFGEMIKAIGQGIGEWWASVWGDIQSLFSGVAGGEEGLFGNVNMARAGLGVATAGLSEVGHAIGLWQSGGYVGRSQLALLHQGERVVAKGGAVTGAARRNMGMTGAGWSGASSGGVNVTISPTIMDRDAIPSLVRSLERVFGAYGRGTSSLFAGG